MQYFISYRYSEYSLNFVNVLLYRDRPAAIAVDVKSIDDTSNFDEFPDVDLKWRMRFLFLTLIMIYYLMHPFINNNDLKTINNNDIKTERKRNKPNDRK